MSFTAVRSVRRIPSRAVLFVVGHNAEALAAAAASSADMVMIEWEDGVPPASKSLARANTIEALHGIDWSDKRVAIRVNALDSTWLYRDLVELLESPLTSRLDAILIPKPGVAADVYAVDAFTTQIERAMRRPRPVAFELMVESAQGVANLHQLAAASPRVEALHFGSVDYASSMGMRIGWGTLTEQYQVSGANGDPWHAVMSHVAAVGKANGLRVIDGVHVTDAVQFDKDPELLAEAARRAAVLGFDGKWAATSGQTTIITDIFSPSAEAVARARAITDVADAAGDTEPVLNGRPLDPATVRDARDLAAYADRLRIQ